MNIELLHNMCKDDARIAFNEFKHQLDVGLFSFNDNLKEDMQNQLIEGLCKKTVKHLVANNNLSSIQISYLSDVTDYYKKLVFKVSCNYLKKNFIYI